MQASDIMSTPVVSVGPDTSVKEIASLLFEKRISGVPVLDEGVLVGATDGDGEYAFQVDDPSTYVVEMALADGYVLGLSNAGTVARYETLQTVVQLPGRWDMGAHRMVMAQSAGTFFGISGANSMTNTTLEMAIDQNITPADNGEPVSPNQ